MTATAEPDTCFFCGSTEPGHRHYTILCYENGTCIGRLGSGGYIVNRKIRALMFGKERAERIAAEIDAEGVFTTKVKPF